jgi:cytoskeletal protein CcmA (bactofilin family)
MFDKKEIETGLKEAETIIGQSVRVKGNFHGQGNVIIEGLVEGNVKTNSFLLVGEKAKITADIQAKEAKIGGKITGNIKIQGYLEIKSTARIKGNIEANQLSIEKGAHLNGHCLMSQEKEAAEKNKK